MVERLILSFPIETLLVSRVVHPLGLRQLLA
jgi:hypothetical protein